MIVLISLLVIAAFYLVIDKSIKPAIEKKQLEGYNQGIQQGEFNVISQQQSQGVLYLFNESGHVNQMQWNELCTRLTSQ